MDSKKKTPPPPIVFQEYEKPAAKSNVKYIIAAVTVVLIVVVTLGAILVTLKLTKGFASDTIKEFALAKKTLVKIDVHNNMTELDDQEKGYSVYNDFSKGFTMLKVGLNASFVCYLSKLNKGVLSPNAMKSYLEHHPDGEKFTSHGKDGNRNLPHYKPAKEEIDHRGFLSEQVLDACAGFPIHWLVPVTEDVQHDGKDGDDTKDDNIRGNAANTTLLRVKRHSSSSSKSKSKSKCKSSGSSKSSSSSSSSSKSSSKSGSSSKKSSCDSSSSESSESRDYVYGYPLPGPGCCYSRMNSESTCYEFGEFCCDECCIPGCGPAPCCYSSWCDCSFRYPPDFFCPSEADCRAPYCSDAFFPY